MVVSKRVQNIAAVFLGLTVRTCEFCIRFCRLLHSTSKLPQVAAFTTWDVHKSMVANSKPLTPEQQDAFEEFARQLQAYKQQHNKK